MSKVQLAKIKSLTFYKDEDTAARRTDPLPQLVCVGKPCKYYQPEVVRCANVGGTGSEVEWKCEADLPDSLRFGRVEVGCEGWSGLGDPNVLKGSCSLEYRLVEIPGALRNSKLSNTKGWFESLNISATLFGILWFAVLGVILYSFLRSCFGGAGNHGTRRAPHYPEGNRPGWFPGGYGDEGTPPPPPYSKNPLNAQAGGGWNPGFWSGAALGGLGAHLLNRNRPQQPEPVPVRRQWDWERPAPSGSGFFSRRQGSRADDNRGEGSSNLGSMRRSTGLGGSNVR